MTTVNRARIVWVDYAKGVGIFLVVLGHTLRGLKSSQVIHDGPTFHLVDTWIYSFHMPLFFLLSGLFAERQSRRSAGVFFVEKLATIAYPYFLWSALQTFVQVAVSRQTNNQASLSSLVDILVTPTMQFWFLYALFLITLAYYGLRRCGLKPLGILAAFAVLWSTQIWLPFVHWFVYRAARDNSICYALGSVIDHHGGTQRIEHAPSSVLTATAILGFGVVTLTAGRERGEMLFLDLAVMSCGIAASIALAVLLSRAGFFDFVRAIGFDSLEIYLAHTIASAGLRIALQKLLKVENPAIHIALGTLGGILLPLALVWLCRRYHAEWLFRFPKREIRSSSA